MRRGPGGATGWPVIEIYRNYLLSLNMYVISYLKYFEIDITLSLGT